MRLYSKTGATRIDSAYGSFTPGASGAFDGLPEPLYEDLHGRPGWESEDERAQRIAAEEIDRFRDPAELLKAVKELGANQGLLTQALASALGLGHAQVPAGPADTAHSTAEQAATSQTEAPPEPDAPQQAPEDTDPDGEDGHTPAEPGETAPPAKTTTARRGRKGTAPGTPPAE